MMKFIFYTVLIFFIYRLLSSVTVTVRTNRHNNPPRNNGNKNDQDTGFTDYEEIK